MTLKKKNMIQRNVQVGPLPRDNETVSVIDIPVSLHTPTRHSSSKFLNLTKFSIWGGGGGWVLKTNSNPKSLKVPKFSIFPGREGVCSRLTQIQNPSIWPSFQFSGGYSRREYARPTQPL